MSFDQDPNEQANISSADLAQMVDHIKELESQLAASEEARKKAEEANGRFRLANKELNDWFESLKYDYDKAMRKLEAAEQRINESQEQESIAWVFDDANGDYYGVSLRGGAGQIPLFKHPIIPPPLEELQRENAELRRQLAATQHVVEQMRGLST